MALTRSSTPLQGRNNVPQLVHNYPVEGVLHYLIATVGVANEVGARRILEAGATVGAALPSGFVAPGAGTSSDLYGVVHFKVLIPGVLGTGLNSDALTPGSQKQAEDAFKATLVAGNFGDSATLYLG